MTTPVTFTQPVAFEIAPLDDNVRYPLRCSGGCLTLPAKYAVCPTGPGGFPMPIFYVCAGCAKDLAEGE